MTDIHLGQHREDFPVPTGDQVHDARLEVIISAPALDDGCCVKYYGDIAAPGYVCVMCDARSNDAAHVHHVKNHCQVEFEQLLALARHLQKVRA